MTIILHVEDDLDLAELVKQVFEEFGFRDHVLAPNVADANRVLSDVVAYPTIDLVITDMSLPDGTGLDVLRSLRANPIRKHIPLLVLSGDSDPATVNRAYALGANAYVPKHMRGRSAFEILRVMSAHWFNDVRLPGGAAQSPTLMLLSTSVMVRRRFAEIYMSYVQHLGADSPEADFWLDLALREGNLSNLFAFLATQHITADLPADILESLRQDQIQNLRILDDLERRPVRTAQDADRAIFEVVGNFDAERFVRLMSSLFPVAPTVIQTLREVAATSVDSIANWIENHSHDPMLRDQLPRLRAQAAVARHFDDPRLKL